MSATAPAAPLAPTTDWQEGFRAGRRACAYAVRFMGTDADSLATRTALAAAFARIEAVETPPADTVTPRAASLESAIRAALAVSGAGLGPEAVTILKAVIQ